MNDLFHMLQPILAFIGPDERPFHMLQPILGVHRLNERPFSYASADFSKLHYIFGGKQPFTDFPLTPLTKMHKKDPHPIG
jgi:hypothetical protein